MEDEPESSQDARVKSLWSSLDPEGHGQLDLAALKSGLIKLDHRRHTYGLLDRVLLTRLQH